MMPAETFPPPLPPTPGSDPVGDATHGVIPYKNPQALTAYYLGIFSLIPVLGLFLGIAAFVLGIKGLKFRKLHPETKGSAHAWIGIILGGLVAVAHLVLIGALFFVS
jgi:hypothetical protein